MTVRRSAPMRMPLIALGAALLFAAGGAAQAQMGGGVIDPPPGAPLVDLPTLTNTSTTPGVVEVSLEAKIAPVNVNGVTANLFTYNGLAPGPVIRVKRGDTLRIHFRNALPVTTEKNFLGFTRNVTNLHTHGLHVSPKEPADAAHIAILPENTPIPSEGLPEATYIGTYDYVYDLAHQDPGSLTFYHSHNHGTVAEQYWGGMIGPMVVEDPTPLLEPYETHILVLKDIALSGSVPAPHATTMDYMHGKEGNTVMVNGQVNPVLPIRPGQVQRWRILNASNARFYKLSLEGHDLQVIGTDGGLLDKAYPQSSIVLSPGERVDVMVRGSATRENYRLLSLPYSRRGMMNSAQITLMTLQCDGDEAEDAVPAVINPEARRMTMDISGLPKKTFALSMMMGRGMINGNDFDMMPDMQMSRLGDYEVWEVTNDSMMDHPWHQHVNSAQVLAITGGDAGYAALYTTSPARKDVTLVPRNGSVTLLVPVLDWPGMTMYHCHILEHEDIGMMGMWDIMADMPMPYALTDVVRALNAGAGIEEVPHADLARLNCEMGGGSMGVVDTLDAIRIARKVAGLEPNP